MNLRLLATLASLTATLLDSGTAGAQGSFVNWETPHVHPLEMTPDGEHLLAVNLPDNRLEVFRLSGDRPRWVESIPVGLDPVSVRARSESEVWVVNHVSDSISVVDLGRGAVVRTLFTDDEPADVVFAGTPERAYVSCSQANTLLVFDPAQPTAPAQRIALRGEDPRALAVSPDGKLVYVAFFESGNGTTVLGGGIALNLSFPPNVVNDPAGPHGGLNPPPNRGSDFSPPITPGLRTPPPVSLIVRQDANGHWYDDNCGDWTELVSGDLAHLSGRPSGWRLLDHDVAILDTESLDVRYAGTLMNLCMAIGVHPRTGRISVVGTEATNEIRFEPNLRGRFVRSHLGQLDPLGDRPWVSDLNPHLDYASGSVPQAQRDLSIADPRAVEWNAAGTRLYVTGMGSNNLVVLDSTGDERERRVIEVGEGPTGLVLDEARHAIYVLNKFDASISVVDVRSETESLALRFHDPTPEAIRRGRRQLYDAHATSGLGVSACAACHVDGRMDRLAWDLGDPSGSMKAVQGQNLGGNVLGLNSGFMPWHPMKGPMVTQTLQDIIGKEPHHWRGDRDGLEEFGGAFQSLLGDDESPTASEIQEFEDFLASLHFPPNPFRTLGNRLPTSVGLAGHFEPGVFGVEGEPLPAGDALAGQRIFIPPRLLDAGGIACVTCHTLPTGMGTHRTLDLLSARFTSIPRGPNNENHLALISIDGATNVTLKVPQLRNLHERTGFDLTQLTNTGGFGYFHDGSVDTLARFVSEPAFTLVNQQEMANLVAFMLAFSGSDLPTTGNRNTLFPPGVKSQDTHAAVGQQVTFEDLRHPAAALVARLDLLLARADALEVGLVAKGLRAGTPRGWYYLGNGNFQSDRLAEQFTRGALMDGSGESNVLTFTLVPLGTEVRIGVDRDDDGIFDLDE